MSYLKLKSLTTVTIIALCASAATFQRGDHSVPAGQSRPKKAGVIAPAQNGPTDCKGLSVSWDQSLFTGMKVETVKATPMSNPTDKPDGYYPEHLRLSFSGSYQLRVKSSYEPEINIYPVAGFRAVFSVAPENAKSFPAEIQRLKRLIFRQPKFWPGEIPYPLSHDASQMFHAKLRYAGFDNGKGVLFLTQYTQDMMLVTNESIICNFQGITSDGQYYIEADFPVSTPTPTKTAPPGTMATGCR